MEATSLFDTPVQCRVTSDAWKRIKVAAAVKGLTIGEVITEMTDACLPPLPASGGSANPPEKGK